MKAVPEIVLPLTEVTLKNGTPPANGGMVPPGRSFVLVVPEMLAVPEMIVAPFMRIGPDMLAAPETLICPDSLVAPDTLVAPAKPHLTAIPAATFTVGALALLART
jgi:hypothetical protein